MCIHIFNLIIYKKSHYNYLLKSINKMYLLFFKALNLHFRQIVVETDLSILQVKIKMYKHTSCNISNNFL